MNGERIGQLIEDLRKAVGSADGKLTQRIADLDIDINQLLLEPPEPELVEEVLAQARELEAQFAQDNSAAQRPMQEIIYFVARL